ncbi:MAG: hypothetical protein COU07_02855 [Candidatus Harrisonbacteria bacterium CG10_big_fil_rev_8_21_14_0_10_40_38]|uniref:DUF5667 domain-containing protein n=1 Tax=Candidatus Harrisonbacteria bacterium CG10_big_fil_rev_8_21_14_0_10_40_38 TaxID=1974583 RepID=A0A2H0UTP3_9BACT|nr:MAG: hypothetical protein COU07_02855 [Candidatus Harrisonbacteria bacterium CG10_big_fil_rev_8_21_14_0_10_40_38]
MRILLIALLTLFIAFPAFAQTEAPMQASQPTKEAMEAARKRFEEAKVGARERFQAKQAELKKDVAVIRDTKKKEILDRVYDSINQLNERLTKHYLDVLDNISLILDRVTERAQKVSDSGVDVSSVTSQVDAAKTAIETARTSVVTQAGKTYEFAITTEANLRSDVGVARNKLRTDLQAVRDQVRAAMQAVRTAAVTLAQLPRPSSEMESDN